MFPGVSRRTPYSVGRQSFTCLITSCRGRPISVRLGVIGYRLPMTEEQFDVVIVGAGFGGIGAAIELKRLGYDNLVILERENDLEIGRAHV